MAKKLTLLKEMTETQLAGALKDVIQGSAKIFILLGNAPSVLIPLNKVSDINRRILPYLSAKSPSHVEQLQSSEVMRVLSRLNINPPSDKPQKMYFDQEHVAPILRPYLCDSGFYEIARGKPIAIDLLLRKNNKDNQPLGSFKYCLVPLINENGTKTIRWRFDLSRHNKYLSMLKNLPKPNITSCAINQAESFTWQDLAIGYSRDDQVTIPSMTITPEMQAILDSNSGDLLTRELRKYVQEYGLNTLNADSFLTYIREDREYVVANGNIIYQYSNGEKNKVDRPALRQRIHRLRKKLLNAN